MTAGREQTARDAILARVREALRLPAPLPHLKSHAAMAAAPSEPACLTILPVEVARPWLPAGGETPDERLAIQAQYAAQATALAEEAAQATQAGAGGAMGVITSLRGYAASLATGEAGSGTAMDRYAASQRQFDAVYGAAAAGDANSISGLQGAAETFRSNARDIFGGGQGYADALRLITDRISNIGGLGADALTQSFVAENARTNTDRVVDQLAALRADINMLLLRPAA